MGGVEAGMEDPRISELLECIDDVDDDGNPTKLALIAKRVQGYVDIVTKLREDLIAYHKDVESLETRAENLQQLLQDRSTLKDDISEDAQQAAVKAAFSNSSRGAALRKDAAEKQDGLRQFKNDFGNEEKRLAEVMRALESRRERMLETRDQIARRMNIIDALLQRAEIEWPAYFFEENDRMKAEARQAAPSGLRRRRRGRGRRRVVRRRAS